MTSWSGGVRTGGWRVKNRSKFSAFRPHYERGREEFVVGGKKKNNQNKTERNKTGWGFLQTLPFHYLREVVLMIRNESNIKCKIFTTVNWHMTLGSQPSVPVARELPLVSFWAVRSWMAKAWDGGAGGMWHVLPTPPQGVSQAHFEGDVIKVTEIFLGHKMQSNDTFIYHLGDPNTKQQVPQSTVLWLSVISGDVF